tara:strand:- start:5532 stop:5786 length:255 start_codon:yes stop_codon:yes gene_type:complete
MIETRKDFISRMFWLISEIETSEKGSSLDTMKLLEFHLRSREELQRGNTMNLIRKHLYENVEGNKYKIFVNYLDVYENQTKRKL